MRILESLSNEFCLEHSQRLRPTVHEMIISEIKSRAVAIEASRPRVDQVQKLLKSSSMGKHLTGAQKNGKNGSFFGAEPGPMAKIQIAAQELLESVLALVLQILGKDLNSSKHSSGLFQYNFQLEYPLHYGPGSGRFWSLNPY